MHTQFYDYTSLVDLLQNGDMDWIRSSIQRCDVVRRKAIRNASLLSVEEAKAKRSLQARLNARQQRMAGRTPLQKAAIAAKKSRSIRAYYAKLTPLQKAEKSLRQAEGQRRKWAGLDPVAREQRRAAYSAAAKKRWEKLTPEQRVAEGRKISERMRAAAYARQVAQEQVKALPEVKQQRPRAEPCNRVLSDRTLRHIEQAHAEGDLTLAEIANEYEVPERWLYRRLEEMRTA